LSKSFVLTGIVLSLFIGTAFGGQSSSPANTCISCHKDLTEEKLSAPVQATQNDVHGSRGLSCVTCHGGDATETDKKLAMNPSGGFIGKPQPAAVAAFCGKCHSNAAFMKTFNPALRVDQEVEYRTSVHSRRIAEGDPKPATCISCHGGHGIRAVKDTSSAVHPLHVAETCGRCHLDELPKYMASVHADTLYKKLDLSAPTCNDCHGNHGAAPPGAASVANVCGTCHVRQSDLFQKSPHKPVFDGLGIADCLACHTNHETVHPTDAMLGNHKPAVCTACHTGGDGFTGAGRMRLAISSLDEQIRSAEEILDRGTRLGMEVSRVKFDLNQARNNLIDARVVVHGFSPDLLDAAVKPGMDIAVKAHEQGLQALDDAGFRRKGLALSLIVIGLTILAIYLKVRDIEKP
jgi:predicted CXXCH cytochrome family protein